MKRVAANFSHQEFNYLLDPLRRRIRELKFDIFSYGKPYGNLGELLAFSEKLAAKLERLRKRTLKP